MKYSKQRPEQKFCVAQKTILCRKKQFHVFQKATCVDKNVSCFMFHECFSNLTFIQ